MFRLLKIKLTMLATLLITSAPPASVASGEGTPAATNQAASVSAVESNLADGLYLVLRSSHEVKKLEPLGETERLLTNDFHFLEPAERERVIYLVVQTKPFVPF